MATLAIGAWERGDKSKDIIAFSTYYCSVFTCPSTVSPIPEIPVAKRFIFMRIGEHNLEFFRRIQCLFEGRTFPYVSPAEFFLLSTNH